VKAAQEGRPGLIGHDEEHGDELRVIEFPRVKGGKPFDAGAPWFTGLLAEIGQIAP
jgi:pyrophosphate--fructose-6-phosphate 1-phosphotransferase